MKRICKKQIARNLDRAIKHEVGEKGLQILIHGWLKYRKYGQKYYEAVRHRKWLFITEVIDLSDYAGYDLSKLEF
jgi:hypothetical protein